MKRDRTADAVRQARYRKRQRRGLAVVAVETDLHRLVDYLIEQGLLTEIEARDFDKVQSATAALLKSVMRYSHPAVFPAKIQKRAI